MKIHLINGTLICPTESAPRQGDLFIDGGKIITPLEKTHFKADMVIDAKNNWVIPSLVDLKGRIHPPADYIKYNHGIKELHAYEKTGFSHVVCFPNQLHCFDNTATIHKLHTLPNLYPIGALTVNNLGEQLSDYSALSEAGCIAFSSGLHPIHDLTILRSAYELLATHNYLVIIFPQEYSLAKNGCAHEGKIATRLGLKSIPRMAESMALLQHLSLIEHTGVRAHFTGLTCHESIDIIRHYKQKGLNISCDVAIAHLHLTEVDIGEFNALCHINPPLRETRDLLALKKGLLDGVINALVSDHTPLTLSHKLAPFQETVPGMSMIDSFLKLCLKSYEDLSLDEILTLNQWVEKFTLEPLKILGLSGGTLQENDLANILVIDPHQMHLLESKNFHAGFKLSPFDQWSFSHVIKHIILKGNIIKHDLPQTSC